MVLTINIPIFKFIELNAIAGGGYYFNRLVDQNEDELVVKARNPYIKGGASLDSVSLDRTYFSAYNNIGNVYYLTGQYEQALAYYKRALNYSDNAFRLINIVKTLYKHGSHEDARTCSLSAVEKMSSFENKYAYLETGTKQTEIRASKRAKMDSMVEWDYD